MNRMEQSNALFPTILFFRREMLHLFSTPLAYLIMTGFFAVSGFFFIDHIRIFQEQYQFFEKMNNKAILATFNVTDAIIRALWHQIYLLVALISPFLTMRLIAGERKDGTLTLLKSLPVSCWQIILGKFLAAFCLVTFMLVLCLIYPIVIHIYSPQGVEWNTVLLGLAALIAGSGVCISLGLLCSTVAPTPMMAAICSLFAMLGLMAGSNAATGMEGTLGEVLRFISLRAHLDNAARGMFVATDFWYLFSVMGLCLFLGRQLLESERWR